MLWCVFNPFLGPYFLGPPNRRDNGCFLGLAVDGQDPGITSWGKGSVSIIIYRVFKNIPGGCLGFLNHQTIVLYYFCCQHKQSDQDMSDRQNEKAWKWTIVGGFAFGVPASLCKALGHFVYHSCTVSIGNEDIHRNPKFGFFKAGMHIFSH